MRSLPLPTILPTDLLSQCIAGTEDEAVRLRLEAVQATLLASGVDYDARARVQTLHLQPRVTAVDTVTKLELLALYTDQMSATNGTGRAAYDQIRNSAPHKKCPLCGVGTVAALDHHLPKSRYPDLAVLPFNLVPICHFCNDSKKAYFPKTQGAQTLHPYYDAYLRGQWLTATLVQGPPPAVVFGTIAPAGWSATDVQRAASHFKACKLGITFTSNASDELVTVRRRLEKFWSKGRVDAIADFLDEEEEIHADRLNSWQHAMYQALAGSDWFITGGFLTIPAETDT